MRNSPPAHDDENETVGITEQIGPWEVEYLWPAAAEQGGPWTVTIRPATGATPTDLAGGISSTIARQLDFQQAAKEWRKQRKQTDTRSERVDTKRAQRLQKLVAVGITDEYLAWLAKTYVALVSEGERSVTARLAELVDKKPETIKIHLKEARKRELLTMVKGRAGGHLTDKSREILGERG
ncbi:hypothetical protein [Antrihabitans stalactiti]|uniref:Uncharacterized protein n=1 Tax=Antrihabitans stalactiti TaxID=2584121 RepID=A0A848K7I1_9NOCA|nr:hypothetical protein [Antrihabitans stalactiti]NMN93556.1 hypothetical protein [Antrihabitans stalactiti]